MTSYFQDTLRHPYFALYHGQKKSEISCYFRRHRRLREDHRNSDHCSLTLVSEFPIREALHVIRTAVIFLLSVAPVKAHPDTLCWCQDCRAESPRSLSVLGLYLENNCSNYIVKPAVYWNERDCKSAHPPTDTYVKSIFTILRGDLIV